jgi:CRISPR-associated protein Cas4
MIENILFKKTPYNLKHLAEIMESSYGEREEDRGFVQKKTFSPSTISWGYGECSRYWPLVFKGGNFIIKHDPSGIDSMQVGTDAHRRIQKNFENSSLNVECEVEITNEDPPIRGFVDLYIKDFNGFNIPVEVKTTRMESFATRRAKREPAAHHELQLLLYLYVMNEKYGLLLYENKNDHAKLLIPVEMTSENRSRIESVINWMRQVYEIYQRGDIPRRPYRVNSKICKSCPIKNYCYNVAPEGNIDMQPLNYMEVRNEKVW